MFRSAVFWVVGYFEIGHPVSGLCGILGPCQSVLAADPRMSTKLRTVQITTEALKTYVNVIENAFGSDVDYAQSQDLLHECRERDTLFSSPVRRCTTKDVTGNPDPRHISTSFVERQN